MRRLAKGGATDSRSRFSGLFRGLLRMRWRLAEEGVRRLLKGGMRRLAKGVATYSRSHGIRLWLLGSLPWSQEYNAVFIEQEFDDKCHE